MIKRKVTTSKEILHNLPYEAISVTLDSKTIGEEVVPAGTVLAGKEKSVFEDRTQKVKEVKNEDLASAKHVDGILLTDVDLTNGDAVGSCVYRGTINADKLADPSIAGNYKDLKEKLPHIQFIKGGK
ncbi:TPA: head decoration protein [Streptococcus pyogenes]|uniref:head decoration protein n=1 Tax=Streptococcus pyogenes TaxID=1314 RepID=UPI002B39F47B|nr:head decoration protein [Streptococcus pyogenes]HER4557258.1 head decoration protein [Streptococcus pyogenes NGAS717]HER4668407.1 head decoration protein [Streptococcus pyogenes NGAS401]HEQ1054578.1 head decoration protein [Streptococcus pyogenes]HEQ1056560.1 head decoration protein [Streptococcus pyogenes]